ncbi:MAG: hypothetical protein KY476_15760 [Planctomycetes bacterium]|nr:hypothetical protein [Planctomycetota bacterium]
MIIRRLTWSLAACVLALAGSASADDDSFFRRSWSEREFSRYSGPGPSFYGPPTIRRRYDPPRYESPRYIAPEFDGPDFGFVQPPPTAPTEGYPSIPLGEHPVEREALSGIGLYPHVKVEDRDNIHPCAVKKIVCVKDPRDCDKCRDRCHCGPPRFVYVEICVPPCKCEKIDVKRKDGSKIEFDYGDYEVELTSKDGVVFIDYDD